jgi:hypothetical protein
MTTPDIEARVRALIERLEHRPAYQQPATSRDHWLAYGMDEAYDNVLDWLYTDVLLEER